jgi:hypothetical protein
MAPESNGESWSTRSDRLVGIHQPNFLPWLGYFDKLARADVFVLLDTVQFPLTGGTWMNRVRLLVAERPAWITVPIVRHQRRGHSVRDVRIDNSQPWRARVLRTIEQNYARAPFFAEVMPHLSRVIEVATDDLATFNENGIRTLAAALQLDPSKIVRASSLGASGRSTDLLVALTRAVGGTAYMCGGGASGYQEDAKFADGGVRLVHQQFVHPVYPQRCGSPIPGLSVVDALMSCGFEGVARFTNPAWGTSFVN